MRRRNVRTISQHATDSFGKLIMIMEIVAYKYGVRPRGFLARQRSMDLRLDGDVALVTGGASGIGFATAQRFVEEGCDVVLWDVAEAVHESAKQLKKSNDKIRVWSYQFDMLDLKEGEAAINDFLLKVDRLDHVVHCAARGSGKFGFPFTNLTPVDWNATIQLNVMGLTNLAHLVTPKMLQQSTRDNQERGTIIVVASVAGQIGSQTDPPYSASKAANINFAQCMAKDLAPHSIRVNTVCPGMVVTDLNKSVWQAWCAQIPPAQRLTYEEWGQKKVESVVPLQRWQTPEDIADMIVFLSSSRAKQVTGQTINVDGGFVMHW